MSRIGEWLARLLRQDLRAGAITAPAPRVLRITPARPVRLERLLVPRSVAEATLAHLRASGRRDCEEFAFWSGHVLAGGGVGRVARAFHPRTKQGRAHLEIDDDAQLLALTDLVHERNELVLCQLHTHPGDAFHSTADDAGAYTDEVGFLSLVVPRFASNGLESAEGYRRMAGGWIHEGRPLQSGLVDVFEDILCYDGDGWPGGR